MKCGILSKFDGLIAALQVALKKKAEGTLPANYEIERLEMHLRKLQAAELKVSEGIISFDDLLNKLEEDWPGLTGPLGGGFELPMLSYSSSGYSWKGSAMRSDKLIVDEPKN